MAAASAGQPCPNKTIKKTCRLPESWGVLGRDELRLLSVWLGVGSVDLLTLKRNYVCVYACVFLQI